MSAVPHASKTRLEEICSRLQWQHGFTATELCVDRGPGSRVAAIALERAMRLSPAALGDVLCVDEGILNHLDHTQMWPAGAVQGRSVMVVSMYRNAALMLMLWLGVPFGVSAGLGWGGVYSDNPRPAAG